MGQLLSRRRLLEADRDRAHPNVYVGPMNKGNWTDWVVHAKWSFGADGVLEIWRDGNKVGTQTGPNNYKTEQPGFFKLGLYK